MEGVEVGCTNHVVTVTLLVRLAASVTNPAFVCLAERRVVLDAEVSGATVKVARDVAVRVRGARQLAHVHRAANPLQRGVKVVKVVLPARQSTCTL